MNGSASLEVHFYSQDEFAVQLGVVADNAEAEKLGKLLTFSCYALRQMVNLGRGQVSDSLAQLLSLTTTYSLQELNSSGEMGGTRLVAYKGFPGNKNFKAALLFAGEDGSRIVFNLTTQGFGILARGMGYYAPSSVMGLLRYLAKEHESDVEFLNGLTLCAGMCAMTYMKRELRIHNQTEAAYKAAWMAWMLPAAERLKKLGVGKNP